MIYLYIYLALGFVLIAQSVIRRWRRKTWDLEMILIVLGSFVIWPIVLISELVTFYMEWRAKKHDS